MAVLSFRQKIMLGDSDPVVLLRGTRKSGLPFFAYVTLPLEQLARLNCDMDSGNLVHLSEYGKVVMQGEGEPNEDQKRYMTQHYSFFDHTDPFGEENDNSPVAAVH